ncbi:MAG: O-antigen ligase family protein [Elusimicrobiales bacterium]|nr:O-antigen ligase family protein [Elusimicrobiales bacterium]
MEILLLLSLVFAPLAFAAVEPWAYVPLYAVFFIGAARLYAKGGDSHDNPLYKTLLPAVLGVAMIGLLQSINQSPVNGPTPLLFTAWRLSTLNAVLLWLFYGAVMYCASKAIKTPAQLQRLLWTIFGMGVFVALMGMLQKTGDDTVVYGLRRVSGQPFGPFVNRDHGAFFLAMAGMAGLGLFFGGFKSLFVHQSHTKFFDLVAVQFLKFIMLAAVIAGLVKTGSRGGLHSFVCAIAFIGFISASFLKTKIRKFTAWSALLLMFACYGLILSKYRLLLGLDGGHLVGAVTTRFSMYKSGWAMFKDFPVFGIGLGAVEHAFPFYARPDFVTPYIVKHVHSDWLELFLQVGVVGGLLYLACFAAAFYGFYRGWLRCRSFTVKAVYGGALGAVLVAMGHSFVDFGSQMPANALAFYALLGALASKPAVQGRGLLPHEDEEEVHSPPPPGKYRYAAFALASLLTAAAVPQFLAWQYDQITKTAGPEEKNKLRAETLKWQPGPQTAFRLAAEYYNQGLKDKTAPCRLFFKANEIAWPYLRQAPLNASLNALDYNLSLQLANCYNRPLILKSPNKSSPLPRSAPTNNSSRP